MKTNTRDVTKDIFHELSPEKIGYQIRSSSYYRLNLEKLSTKTWAVTTKSLDYARTAVTKESVTYRVLTLKGKPVMGSLKKIKKLLPQIIALPITCYECGFEIIDKVWECPDYNPYCEKCYGENIFPCTSPKCDEFASRGENYCKYCKEE